MKYVEDAYMTVWMSCGLAVVLYDGLAEKDILIPVDRFRAGERKFGYISFGGASEPCHKLTPKQTAKAESMIAQYDLHRQRMKEIKELTDKVINMRLELASECPNFSRQDAELKALDYD